MPTQILVGDLVKQYGQFSLRTLSVRKDDLVFPTNRYQICLERGEGKKIDLVSIERKKSDWPDFLNHIYEWLRSQYIQIEQTKQNLAESQDADVVNGFQALLDRWEERFDLVLDVINTLDPLYDQACWLHDIRLGPKQHIGNIAKRYGRFLLREIEKYNSDDSTDKEEYQISLLQEQQNELVLGSIFVSNSKFPDILQFIVEWIASYNSVIEMIKKRLLETHDAEERKSREAFLEMHRHSLQAVTAALNEMNES